MMDRKSESDNSVIKNIVERTWNFEERSFRLKRILKNMDDDLILVAYWTVDFTPIIYRHSNYSLLRGCIKDYLIHIMI